MKILVVSDHENRKIWDFFEPGMLDAYDLILSCGDLKPEYLSFLATMSHAEVLYVHGNHDRNYQKNPPEGCTPIDDRIFEFRGLRILGLGGSMRYKPGPCMCTEAEMKRRISKLRFRIRRKKGFDILLTHAPAAGINDQEDLAHNGFQCFLDLIDKYHPTYFLHGHVHGNYGKGFKRLDKRNGTVIINGYDKYEIDIPDESLPFLKRRDSRKNHSLPEEPATLDPSSPTTSQAPTRP